MLKPLLASEFKSGPNAVSASPVSRGQFAVALRTVLSSSDSKSPALFETSAENSENTLDTPRAMSRPFTTCLGFASMLPVWRLNRALDVARP